MTGVPSPGQVFLIREPHGLLLSFDKALGSVNTYDTCLPDQVKLLNELTARGKSPIVVVAEDLLENPEGILKALCQELGLAYDPNMMTWAAGGRPEDGCWAYLWYANTHKSTGFDPQVRTKPTPLPAKYEAVYDECKELFEKLTVHKIKPL